jgi:hypothetical protein
MTIQLKKFFILLLIPNILFNSAAFAKNQPAKKKPVIIINKTENQKQVEQFDFRKANWGMSHQQVKDSEDKQPISQGSDRMEFPDNLLGVEANVNYFFEDGKLIKAAYIFEGTFSDAVEYIINFRKIKKALLDKYGSPFSDNSNELDIIEKEMYKQVGELISRGVQEYETKWDTPNTNIKLLLKGKDLFTKVKLELGYTSKQLKHLDEDKEVIKDKF